MVSHIDVRISENILTSKNIGEALKGPQCQAWTEDLFIQYNENKNVKLILDPIII